MEKEKFIDKDGVVIEINMEKISSKDINFSKVWLKNFCQVIETITPINHRYKFLSWLLLNMNRENEIGMTLSDMEKASNISKKTIIETIKSLKSIDFIRKIKTVYMINPDVIFKGGTNARQEARRKYYGEEKA